MREGMKISALNPGIYFDGKKGLRLLLCKENDMVEYQKVRATGSGAQVLPGTVHCPAADFARWSRLRLEPADLHSAALSIAARSVPVSHEQARRLLVLGVGDEVRGKVRTSLLEKELVSWQAESAVVPRLREPAIRVVERLRASSEKKT